MDLVFVVWLIFYNQAIGKHRVMILPLVGICMALAIDQKRLGILKFCTTGYFIALNAYINKKSASSFEKVFEMSIFALEFLPLGLFFNGSAFERKKALVILCISFIAHGFCYTKDTVGFALLDVNLGHKTLKYQRFSIYLTLN